MVGFSVDTDLPYIAEVELRGELPVAAARNVYWHVKQRPWRQWVSQTAEVTSEWKKFTMSFQQEIAIDAVERFGLSIENVGARLQIRNWRLYRAGRTGLSNTKPSTSRMFLSCLGWTHPRLSG